MEVVDTTEIFPSLLRFALEHPQSALKKFQGGSLSSSKVMSWFRSAKQEKVVEKVRIKVTLNASSII